MLNVMPNKPYFLNSMLVFFYQIFVALPTYDDYVGRHLIGQTCGGGFYSWTPGQSQASLGS